MSKYSNGRGSHLRSASIEQMRGSSTTQQTPKIGTQQRRSNKWAPGQQKEFTDATQQAGGLYNVVRRGPMRSGSTVALHKGSAGGAGMASGNTAKKHDAGVFRKKGSDSDHSSGSGPRNQGGISLSSGVNISGGSASSSTGRVSNSIVSASIPASIPNKVGARPEGKKIIFLDVDGVLHSVRVTRQEQLFNPQKMALLRKMIANTDAQIVLSSAWRRTPPTLRMCYQMLHRHGIDAPIDITPDYGLCAKRSSEILYWVDKFQPATWVAIDDLDLHAGEPRMRGHFLKCNPLIGVTNDLVEYGISVLNGGR